jgi:tetratricopeptide (TPR) repeat protein
VDDAIVRFNESLEKARGLNDSGMTAYALRCLGQAAAIVGDFDSARSHIAEAITIYERGDSTLEAAWTNGELAEVEFRAGDFQQAIALAAQSLAACREFGDERTTIVLGNLAAYYIAAGRYGEGADLALESLTLAIDHQREGLVNCAMQHLASSAVLRFRDRTNATDVFVGAAEIFGFVDARLSELGTVRLFVERQEYDRVRAILDAATAKDVLASSFARGAKMTEAQAARRALDLVNAGLLETNDAS